jgi:hypothetical protein
VETLLDVYTRGVRKKNYRFKCCNDASSTKKRFMKKYICWYAHEETYVPHDTMVDVITQFWVIPQNSIFFKIKIK